MNIKINVGSNLVVMFVALAIIGAVGFTVWWTKDSSALWALLFLCLISSSDKSCSCDKKTTDGTKDLP